MDIVRNDEPYHPALGLFAAAWFAHASDWLRMQGYTACAVFAAAIATWLTLTVLLPTVD